MLKRTCRPSIASFSQSSSSLSARDYLSPRYWPTWLGLGSFWLLSRFPLKVQLGLGRLLGTALYHCAPARRRSTLTNLRLAFPDMPVRDRARLALDSYRHMGMAVAETAYLWFRNIADLDPLFTLEGREHLDSALARGKGVILLQAHFTTIDVCSNAMGSQWPISAVYDSPKNSLYADFLLKARSRYMHGMIDNRDIRNMIRRLRKGEIVWYSPDQSVHRKNGGITTSYFGVPVLTSSGTARIVAMTGATIIPYVPTRSPKGGQYVLRFMAPLTLDCDNTEVATQLVNDHLEAQVRSQPEQYLWAHKRFKPPGPEFLNPYRSASPSEPPKQKG